MIVLLASLLSALASAHDGGGMPHTHGFGAALVGLFHPLGGFDHLVAALAVGILAVANKSRLLPVAFVVGLILGGTLGFLGVAVPMQEAAIALSVGGLGAFLLFQGSGRTLAFCALVFGAFHGSAHAAELAPGASALWYCAGFVASTSLLHLVGILAATAMRRLSLAEVGFRFAGAASVMASVICFAILS